MYLVLARRLWAVGLSFGLAAAGAAAAATYTKPVYEATGAVQLLKKATGAEAGLAMFGISAGAGASAESAVVIFRSDAIVEQVIASAELRDPLTKEALSPERFLSFAKVAPMRGTEVVQFSFESADPTVAAQVIDTWMEVALQDELQTNRRGASSAVTQIKSQLAKAQTQLAESERALLAYQRASGSVNVGEETSGSLREVQSLEGQLREAEAAYMDAAAQANSLRARLGLDASDALALASVAQNRTVAKLKDELLQLETTPLGQDLTPDHPKVIERKVQADRLRQRIRSEVATLVGGRIAVARVAGDFSPLRQQLAQDLIAAEIRAMGFKQRAQSLGGSLAKSRAKLARLPEQDVQITRLTRNVRLQSDQVQALAARLGEARIIESREAANMRVIQPARVSDNPVRPNKLHLLLKAVLGALFASALLVGLFEYFDRRMFTIEELREDLADLGAQAFVAAIPVHTGAAAGGVEVLAAPESFVSERYRIARGRLKHLMDREGVKSLIVTSATPAEGKTTFSANLACVMAAAGVRTLLIDGDLRRPRLHEVFESQQAPGLAAVLEGKTPLDQAIVDTKVQNLALLPCPSRVSGPSELLESAAFGRLMAEATGRFDLVLVDGPPLNGLPDTRAMVGATDGVLMVAGISKVLRDEFTDAFARLSELGVPIRGVIAQGAAVTSRDYRYYEHYYGDGQRRPWLKLFSRGRARQASKPPSSTPLS